MYPESDHTSIESAIGEYARAYKALEDLQEREAKKKETKPGEMLLPHKGDQKTGLIGEYWAIRYARLEFKGATITFGGHSNKGWDLEVKTAGGKSHYIQVKTASAFGKGGLSPICSPKQTPASKDGQELPDFWNELWLLWLDRDFKPVTLWKLKPEHVTFNETGANAAKSIRRSPSDPTTGSKCFDWKNAEAVTDIRARLGIA
jgi:hypothetical protein